MYNSFKFGDLMVVKSETREQLGRIAAEAVQTKINDLFLKKEEVNIIFAAAPSQIEFLDNLVAHPGIDWSRINGFHMDEYLGLPDGSPALFRRFLDNYLFDRVSFKSVHYLHGTLDNAGQAGERYSRLLGDFPPDIICLGIGENGHVAFNDPENADFQDSKNVKVVLLDETCRMQQVNDGCFASLEEVPESAITLTIPMLLQGTHLFCMVPGERKRWAVRNTLKGPVSTKCPASILRTHPSAVLFGDEESLMDIK